jgi:hypothetical protein
VNVKAYCLSSVAEARFGTEVPKVPQGVPTLGRCYSLSRGTQCLREGSVHFFMQLLEELDGPTGDDSVDWIVGHSATPFALYGIIARLLCVIKTDYACRCAKWERNT